MAQEMNVLHCSSCKTYQVSIVKKANKWQCKVCNFKQPLKQVYFKGSGKDCRIFVQKLNIAREQECEENLGFGVGHNMIDNSVDDYPEPKRMKISENKWAKYTSTTSTKVELIKNFATLDNQDASYGNTLNSYSVNNEYSMSKCLDTEYANISNNAFDEKEFKQDSEYHNGEEHGNDVVENVLKELSHNDDNNKDDEIRNKKNTDLKCTKNIFDDNEDFDLVIDF